MLSFESLIELHDDIMRLHKVANERIPVNSEYTQVAVALLLGAANILDAADNYRRI